MEDERKHTLGFTAAACIFGVYVLVIALAIGGFASIWSK